MGVSKGKPNRSEEWRKNLTIEQLLAGSYKVSVNFKDLSLPEGIYDYRISVGGYSETNKMIFSK